MAEFNDSDDEGVAQQQCYTRTTLLSLPSTEFLETTAKITKDAESVTETGEEDTETDIENFLEEQPEVVSYVIEKERIKVGLLRDDENTKSRIENRYKRKYQVNFDKGQKATAQHSTGNVIKPENGGCATVGVTIYRGTPSVGKPHTAQFETDVESPSPKPAEPVALEIFEPQIKTDSAVPVTQAIPDHSVDIDLEHKDSSAPTFQPMSSESSQHQDNSALKAYVSTAAHVWPKGQPDAKGVRCYGRVELTENGLEGSTKIAVCPFPGKCCCYQIQDQSLLICTNEPIPCVFDPKKGCDICLIPMQFDLPAAIEMLTRHDVERILCETSWNKDAQLLAVFGQHKKCGLTDLLAVRAKVIEPRMSVDVENMGMYRRIIRYELASEDYLTRPGDSGSPLFTLESGKLKLLGFHVAAILGTVQCFAVPAEANLKRVLEQPSSDSLVYIPQKLAATLSAAA